ncbi:MAG: hypothetical protein E6H07_14385 [Bacteroidetes bacterium]|nr:MAG: hypothetical protein E6H07_14385 [Bacteroidota bacterium]
MSYVPSIMTFHQKLSAYTLSFLTDKDLPDIAMTGLEEGYDSESLRILAGHNVTDNSFVLRDYFRTALKELGLRLKERREALINVVAFYAKSIIDKKTDTYPELEKLNEIINKTEFDWDDIGLMPCYADYISIWEEKTDGLDFHTADGLTKEGYIIKTEEKIRKYLEEWLITNGGI